MTSWFHTILAHPEFALQQPQVFALACVAKFAYEAARHVHHGLDPDDVAQDMVEVALRKLKRGASFALNGQTRTYAKTGVTWLNSKALRRAALLSRYQREPHEQHADLVEDWVSPGLQDALGRLSQDDAALVFRVVVDEVPFTRVADESARTQARAEGVEWAALTAGVRKERTDRAYNTLKRRVSRLLAGLRSKLK